MTLPDIRRKSAPHHLVRAEIGLLKHLALFSPTGIPIAVPGRFQAAFAPLWRLALIDIWYRQDRGASGQTQFISITVEGARRIDTILSRHGAGR